MPSRHSIKTYSADSYYHIYNRGVEKRKIFLDDADFGVLLSYLKTYLLPKNTKELLSIVQSPVANWREKYQANRLLRLNNFSDSIDLIAYSLMPNHYHMLIRQSEDTAIDQFMNSLWTRFTMYFNNKYHRVGTLFQDVYKAVLIERDEQLLYLSRYIHRNIIAKRLLRNLASKGDALQSYSYSSYLDYIGVRNTEWVKPDYILSYWNKSQQTSYKNFVLQDIYDDECARIIASVII